eukprot:TRINITY_DN93017_c0_g1_i1.p2 TRINITY_DN93017_c0_g1~~TRINITY_DN93017_c0_g1_i1.p2  ORF type:complete len:183 (+),score=70.62 TRINITY_DN93017_c0_g1_i1:98-646(+)
MEAFAQAGRAAGATSSSSLFSVRQPLPAQLSRSFATQQAASSLAAGTQRLESAQGPSVGWGTAFASAAVVAAVGSAARRRQQKQQRLRQTGRRVLEFDAEDYWGKPIDFYSNFFAVCVAMFFVLFVVPFVMYFNKGDDDDENEDEEDGLEYYDEEDETPEVPKAGKATGKEKEKDVAKAESK